MSDDTLPLVEIAMEVGPHPDRLIVTPMDEVAEHEPWSVRPKPV